MQETKMYDDWRHDRYPNMADILDEFPSLRLPPTFLLTLFPLIQPRFYSISSSLNVTPGHIHLTVAVLQFKTEGQGSEVKVLANIALLNIHHLN
jgi:sulfite reductase alpha subunit-like flavoprotein